MTIATMPEEHVRELARCSVRRAGRLRSSSAASATPNRIEKQQHLEDVALGEGVDDVLGDDVEQEVDRAERLRADDV